MQFSESNKKGHCRTCGKVIPVRSTRSDPKKEYCSRICASADRYQKRYQGSMAGPADRPTNILDKTKWERSGE